MAFVIDVFVRRIVGWRESRTAHAFFVLDALEQALHERHPVKGSLVHHSDRGGQYLSIRYTERLINAGIEPSVGSVGSRATQSNQSGQPQPASQLRRSRFGRYLGLKKKRVGKELGRGESRSG